MTLPASLHLCEEDFNNAMEFTPVDSDDSTVACTSWNSGEWTATLHTCEEDCNTAMDFKPVNSNDSTIACTSWNSDEWTAMSEQASRPRAPRFQSSAYATGSCKAHHKARLDKVIRRAAKKLEACDMIAKVDIADGSLTIQVHGTVDRVTPEVATLAQKILLELTEKSNCIYVLGFATQDAFRMHDNGFELTFGAMESATRACWHVFKKGYCRYGSSCSNQHPILTVLMRVIIKAIDTPIN